MITEIILFIILLCVIMFIVSISVSKIEFTAHYAKRSVNTTGILTILLIILFFISIHLIYKCYHENNKIINDTYLQNNYTTEIENSYEDGYADCIEDIFNGTLSCEEILNTEGNENN